LGVPCAGLYSTCAEAADTPAISVAAASEDVNLVARIIPSAAKDGGHYSGG
jgi:hypothetical protein